MGGGQLMLAIIKRDLMLALRQGGGLGLTLGFFLIFIIYLPLGIGGAPEQLSAVASGTIWIAALLASLLTLERIFQLDFEDGSLDILASAPLPLASLALGKLIAHWLSTSIPLCVAALPLAYLLHLPSGDYALLLAALLIGSPAFSAIGTFGASLTISVKRGGLLLSLLVLPLYMPSLLIGAAITNAPNPLAMLALLGAISLGSVATLPLASARALLANLS